MLRVISRAVDGVLALLDVAALLAGIAAILAGGFIVGLFLVLGYQLASEMLVRYVLYWVHM
jgi:hypothetical protein